MHAWWQEHHWPHGCNPHSGTRPPRNNKGTLIAFMNVHPGWIWKCLDPYISLELLPPNTLSSLLSSCPPPTPHLLFLIWSLQIRKIRSDLDPSCEIFCILQCSASSISAVSLVLTGGLAGTSASRGCKVSIVSIFGVSSNHDLDHSWRCSGQPTRAIDNALRQPLSLSHLPFLIAHALTYWSSCALSCNAM